MSKTKKVVFFAILLLLVGAFLEVASYLVGTYLAKNRGVLYIPQLLEGYDVYLSQRDPLLGWPAPAEFGGNEYDETGSRIIPAFPNGPPCVSLYGDSFTYGTEVDHDHAWSNVLSRLLDCRAANYGVVSYGTDQAYLRFKQNSNDEANLVILSHFSAGIYRNASQFRTLTVGVPQFDLKPRFILDNQGQLQLIPLPNLTKNEYAALVENPASYLHYEYFVPGGPSGLQTFKFPYTWSVIQSLNHERMRSNLIGKPWYADFYLPGHPSQALPITVKIIQEFQREAQASDKTPLVLILPARIDLEYFQDNGYWVYQNLIDELKKQGIEPLNIGEGMVNYLGTRDACELFVPHNCSGHLNEEGNEVLAGLVYNYLKDNNLLPAPSPAPVEAGSR